MTSKGDAILWEGSLRGAQKYYKLGILWKPNLPLPPWVFLTDPVLSPREGGTFEEIPHLYFIKDSPTLSGLCLFNGSEWDHTMMIADTTVPWAAKWLFYYELWVGDGIWRGGGVVPESTTTRPTSVR
jgi:hypothetical protein